jgi:hypothetical protein
MFDTSYKCIVDNSSSFQYAHPVRIVSEHNRIQNVFLELGIQRPDNHLNLSGHILALVVEKNPTITMVMYNASPNLLNVHNYL